MYCSRWTADVGFVRRAITTAAVANARCKRTVPWRKAMSVALTDAWHVARAAKRIVSH